MALRPEDGDVGQSENVERLRAGMAQMGFLGSNLHAGRDLVINQNISLYGHDRRPEYTFNPQVPPIPSALFDRDGEENAILDIPSQDRINAALKIATQILAVAKAAATVFPPVSNSAGILQVTTQNEADRKAIRKRLDTGIKRLERCVEGQDLSSQMVDRLFQLKNDMEADFGDVSPKMQQSWWKELVESGAEVSLSQYRKLSSIMNKFIAETAVDDDGNIEALATTTKLARQMAPRILANVKPKELGVAEQVVFDAGPTELRGPCTSGTRTYILDDLMTWLTDDTGPQVYWLNSMAGIGKTTIAYSFCRLAREVGLLCSSYFCTRALESTQDPKVIIPTISYHIASRSQASSDALHAALQDPDNIDIRHKDVKSQFTALFTPVARALASSKVRKRRLIVCDGWDEAFRLKEAADIISLFLLHGKDLPIKIFISSRRDEEIKNSFDRRGIDIYSAFVLHNVEHDVVEADIRLYVIHRLDDITVKSHRWMERNEWITEPQINELVRRAGNLFVYASVLCSFLDHGPAAEVKERLYSVLNQTPILGIKDRHHEPLDALYIHVLNMASKELEHNELMSVLCIIVSAREPLDIQSIAALLNFAEYRVQRVVSHLHSVLTVPEDLSESIPIVIFHVSFRDFLIDIDRSRHYVVDLTISHEIMATNCLEVMERLLTTNDICNIMDKDLLRSSILIKTVQACIPPVLQYSCDYCWSHVIELKERQFKSFEEQIIMFFNQRILRWIECMAWMGKLDEAVYFLRRVELSQMLSSTIRSAATDARRAVLRCYQVIREHPLEIYHSALVWLPKASQILRKFGQWQQWNVICGQMSSWEACESIITVHAGAVASVAFSPDGQQIVSGSRDSTVRIWNVETGQEQRSLKGHINTVRSVAFSPDGQRVVSGSHDGTVRIWNVETGQEEKTLKDHMSFVRSVAFSPDGEWVVAGSDDGTVQIWDVQTGQEKTLESHVDHVWSVAVSPDGQRIISGSNDNTVQMWDVQTGQEEKTLKGHMGFVRSVAFSSDGQRVVSGSDDKTVRIWNVETGQEEKTLKGHTGYVQSVAFSPDGQQVVSGSDDNTVRIWNVETRQEKGLKGHTDNVRSVTFSSDGQQVVSELDVTSVRILNIEMGRRVTTLKGHTGYVQAVAFSPDGQRIVSGSGDNTVRIWNVEMEQEKISSGHTHMVWSIAFSPDRQRVVSGSYDKTVRIWNVETGQEEKILKGHTRSVQSVAFSPDGQRVASGSYDKTIRIWNTETGQEEKTLKGHTRYVLSVAFSPDGQRVVSGSYDNTVRIWNVETGQEEETLKGHTGWVQSVAFSPDGQRVISQSPDGVRKVWVINTTAEISNDQYDNQYITSPIKFEDNWLCSSAKASRCYVPYLSEITAVALSPTAACFGFRNGRFIIVKENTTHPTSRIQNTT